SSKNGRTTKPHSLLATCHFPLTTALHNADRVHIDHHRPRRDSLPVALVRQAAQDFMEAGARARFQQELDAVATFDSRQRRRSGTEDLDALRQSVQALEKFAYLGRDLGRPLKFRVL